MSDDRSTGGNRQFEQPDVTQSERREILANDAWIGGGRTETADELMQRRAAIVDRQFASVAARQSQKWIGGSPEPTTHYAQARLDDIEDRAMIGDHRSLAPREPVYGTEIVGANWSPDPAGLEPVLGYSVDDLNDDQLANNPNILLAQPTPEACPASGMQEASPPSAGGEVTSLASPPSPSLRRRI